MDANDDEEEGIEGEEDDGVDEDGDDTGVEFAALDHPRFARDLKDKPWGQKDEEHEGDEHRTPVLHLLLLLF